MAQITVKYDPSLEIEQIEDLIYATNPEEDPIDSTAPEVQQTKITGITAPLIKVNKIIIKWDDIKSFYLESTGVLPTLSLSFYDTTGFTQYLDQPGNDNQVLVQILPPFENAYKKINLKFFISSVSIRAGVVYISGIYNVPALYNSYLKSFGNISTYEFVDKIAKEAGLGLASNIDGTEDSRYIYINNQNYIDALKNEIARSGDAHCVLDVWVDMHNYLVIADMYERYNANDNDLKVWTTTDNVQDVNNDGKPLEALEIDAVITNHNAINYTQLFSNRLDINNSSGSSVQRGTDKIIETYFFDKEESSSALIQDGDIKKDTFIKSIYKGEIFGDHDYLFAAECRSAFLQKIRSTCIDVVLSTPLLGLERGGRVNIKWYVTDDLVNNIQKDMQDDVNTNIPTDPEENKEVGVPMLNKQLSGQYLIIGTQIKFLEGEWEYRLTLSRPASTVNTYF
jgi:hypothetical protein